MATSLEIDLGKSKSVACVHESKTAVHGFEAVASTPSPVEDPLRQVQPGLGGDQDMGAQAGRVSDLVRAEGLRIEVAKVAHEA